MSGRAFIRTLSVGALVLGAAGALGGCGKNDAAATADAGPASTTQAANDGAPGSSAGAGQAGGAGGSAASPSQAGTAGGSGGSADCANHLDVKLGTRDFGATHRSMVLIFTNNGSSACDLSGYPGATVTADGQHGFAPDMNAQRTVGGYFPGASTVTTVALAPGASASAILEWDGNTTNSESASAANCPGMAGGYLEITPPDATTAAKFQPPADMCTDLQIHPVVAGTSGRSAS